MPAQQVERELAIEAQHEERDHRPEQGGDPGQDQLSSPVVREVQSEPPKSARAARAE